MLKLLIFLMKINFGEHVLVQERDSGKAFPIKNGHFPILCVNLSTFDSRAQIFF